MKFKAALLGIVLAAGLILAAPKALAAGCPNGTVSDGSCKCALPSNSSFFSLPPWWEFLNGSTSQNGACTPYVSMPAGIWAVGLAILDMLLKVAGIAAVISLLVSSVMYVTSAGNTDKAKAALDRIINSLIGLAIVLVASGIVAFIGNRL